MITINEENVLYFFMSIANKTRDGRIYNDVINFLNETNMTYTAKFVEDLGLENIEYIVKLAMDNLIDDTDLSIEDSLLRLNTFLREDQKELLKQNGIDLKNLSTNDIAMAIHLVPKLIKSPILIKDGVLINGNNIVYECQQFLEGDARNDIKWLGGNQNWSDNQKIDWLIKQYKLPKNAYVSLTGNTNSTKLYFPKTSVLYGGNIKWECNPLDVVDECGLVLKPCKKLQVIMSIKLDEGERIVEYNLPVLKKYD